jgi:hypothetical protein
MISVVGRGFFYWFKISFVLAFATDFAIEEENYAANL